MNALVAIQLSLFARRPKPTPAKPLVCAFGTSWLAHFQPPIGTGEGCPQCERGLLP